MKFHHFGIACENIEDTLVYVREQFEIQSFSEEVYDAAQDAYLKMVILKDGTQIELISGNAVKMFIKKNRFLYHTCFSTSNIDEKINEMQRAGDFLVKEPREAVLFQNKRVAFVMTKLGLVELLEE